MTTQAGLVVTYNYSLVALSIFIAILAAYAALDLSGRVTTAKGFKRLAWLGGGAIAMGSGIWAMHYVGMEAFSLSLPVLYDWPTVLLSLICAILASGAALYIVSQPTMGLYRKVVGSVVMGSGIAAMHYTGMAAMRMPVASIYEPGPVVLSITLSIAISYIALRITFALRRDLSSWSSRKIGGAIFLGAAIPVTHYVGMAAVTFVPATIAEGSLRHAVSVSDISLFCIVLITLVLLAIVFVSASMHRHLISEAKQFEGNYLQLLAVFDCMTDAIVVADYEAGTIMNNLAAVRLLGLEKKLTSFAEAQDIYEAFLFNGEQISLEDLPLARAGHGDYSTNTEVVLRNKASGTTATTEMTTVPLVDPSGKSPKVIMSIRDVSERRVLEENYLQLLAVFDGMTDAVNVVDFEAKTVLHNQASVKLYGVDKKLVSFEEIRDTFEGFLPSGEQILLEQSPMMRAAHGDYCTNEELVLRRKDSGASFTTEMTAVPLVDSLGKSSKVIMSVRDISERRILEDNYLQLQRIFDSMTDAIVVADFEAKTLLLNQVALKLLGIEKKLSSFEEVHDSIEGFLPSGEKILFEQSPLMRAARGDYSSNIEILLCNKDKSKTTTTEMTTVPLLDSLGKSSKAILSIRDVGARRLAEEQIRHQKTQLQNIFDNVNDGILLMDMDRNIVLINRAASDLLGILTTTLPRKIVEKVFEVMSLNGDPVPRDKWPSTLAYNGDFVQSHEFMIRRTDTGRTVLVQISTAPVLDSSGKVMQIIFSYRDIKKAIESDEQLKKLAAIVESSEDAIIGKNYDGVITSWNRGAEKIFGYPAEETIGQPSVLLFPPDHANEEDTIITTIRQGKVVEHYETVRVRKDGQFINVWLTISPLRDADGKVIGASEIARDITERMKLESQLQLSQKMDAIGQLTGGIAHDFNNLLSIVIGNLDLLKRQIGSDEAAVKQVHTAQKAALRGAELTRRLLAFSCNESLSPVPNDVHHLIRNMIEMTDRLIGPEIEIAMHFDESISDVLVDAAGLESALVNLMVNARDAMPKGGTITISTRHCDLENTYPPVQAGELRPGSYACVSVSDTGQGMSRQTLEHVFEPFFTTKPRGKGTGLGLAMVYGFMKQSNGTVRIYSERDYGTTVTLYLPVDDDASLSVAEAVEPENAFKGKATVLVVDDELDLLDIAIAFVNGMGWKAFTAIDGDSALKVIEQEKDIDVMITDIIMPGGMDGAELAQKVRLLNPRIKIIYCSGFPSDALAEHGMPLVDGPLLHKPYQRNEFSAMLRSVMQTEQQGTTEGTTEGTTK